MPASLLLQSHSEMVVCKVEQHDYVKIPVLHSGNAWECRAGLHEALDDGALQYQTGARWAQAFKGGRVSTAACITVYVP
jgi:hypothetical protein